MKFGCSFGIFLNSAHLICRSTDISMCFSGSLRLRDNESRLYWQSFNRDAHLTYMFILKKELKFRRNISENMPDYTSQTSAPDYDFNVMKFKILMIMVKIIIIINLIDLIKNQLSLMQNYFLPEQ